MEREFDRLNAADGALGDGDLGITMTRGMALVAEAAPDLPTTSARRCFAAPRPLPSRRAPPTHPARYRADGYGQATKGRATIEVAELRPGRYRPDAMIARGKAELGGKTVLDSLDAVAKALDGVTDPPLRPRPRPGQHAGLSTPFAPVQRPSAAPASSPRGAVVSTTPACSPWP